MPFDPIGFKLPHVTVLPPTPPPERGGRPQRVHIEIEFVDRRNQKPPPPTTAQLLRRAATWLLVFALIGALAGCGPTIYTERRDQIAASTAALAREKASTEESIHIAAQRQRDSNARAVADFRAQNPGVPLTGDRVDYEVTINGVVYRCTEWRYLTSVQKQCHRI